MTKIIGLTGGIGSGKTTIGNYFRSLGIPVYMVDDEGRKITDREDVVRQIENIFGSSVIENGKANRKKLSEIVFNDKDKLRQLNQIIHPAVRKNFEDWMKDQQDQPFIIRESAILFESGRDKDCDFIISVIAPMEERIKRVMQRDQVSRESVLERINNQLTDEERISKSDFIIENSSIPDAEKQAKEILKNL